MGSGVLGQALGHSGRQYYGVRGENLWCKRRCRRRGRPRVCVCILMQMYVHTDVCLYVLVCLDVNAYMFVDV